MNVVDQFLSKVGKQTLLTSKAMMSGFLSKEEAEELERLRAIDFGIDMQVLNSWGRCSQSGMFRSKLDINGVNLTASAGLLELANRLAEIEIKYEISSIESDLSRWSEIIGVLNTAVDEFNITKEEVNALMYFYFVLSNRLTIYPTAPSVLRATIPTFISEQHEHQNNDELTKFVLNKQVFIMIEDVLDADRNSWNAEHENHEANKHNELQTIIYKFLRINSQTKLIEFASNIFTPQSIKDIAARSFTNFAIGLLDGVRENIIDEIDKEVKDNGFIDYRLLLVSMFITQVRFALENEVEK